MIAVLIRVCHYMKLESNQDNYNNIQIVIKNKLYCWVIELNTEIEEETGGQENDDCPKSFTTQEIQQPNKKETTRSWIQYANDGNGL